MNVEKLRKDFPVLNKDLIYLDSACMTLRPRQVIDKIIEYYTEYPACGERSYHKLSRRTAEEFENARILIKKFINCKKDGEVVFTKNATEAINLVANSFEFSKMAITDREHNSNLLPWHKFKHFIVKSNEDETFDMNAFQDTIKKVDLISFVFTSNLDGYTLPVKEIIKVAHENDVVVMLDGAQAVPHKKIDVSKLDVDLMAFSGHKMLGPSGTGCLYGKRHILDKMKTFIIGGDTVNNTTYDKFELKEAPYKFEAGLQNYAGVIGLGAAVKYLTPIIGDIESHEEKLWKYMRDNLDVEMVGVDQASGIFSFNIPKMTSHEIAQMLDSSANIAIRSGMHCVHSWFNSRKLSGSARASFYLYNTMDEAKRFVEEVKKIIELR
ncbi:MAG: aminotransferase class V-fold PLP-dependent enzyme [Nanoarchaeota archaeon]|nr:aminotransferase class V-fold PLP-dependent enzyme [Nanoarchaeota archaeon]MBU1444668.1 aminotransferase class V-fold PLP-dependent enzyme [Nanoarchaeota archaeon]MBU2406777.1 aminotransferase class V-fold PLP-dependent enzyme [Nanoarchaeota archaeon]MBU2420314.1 aminotransferase class V-fold PLP-dependent enzyme [Nanoarchaeota archaeon]MBU2475018.1 aminotransferase class V-fold PLP-dependent enzyme [Nanoarchaeota archaeon]